jgi:hypothetical protein
VIQLVIPILRNNETVVKGSKHKKADEQCNKSYVTWSRSSTLFACFADWSGGTNNGLRCTHYQESAVESENVQILGWRVSA